MDFYHRDPATASSTSLDPISDEVLRGANGITEARVEHLARQCAELLEENAALRIEVEILEQRIAALEVTP